MKRKLRYILYIASFISLIACNFSDYYISIGDGFAYIEEGGKMTYISDIYDNTIPPTVISYDYDSLFIVAKQRPEMELNFMYYKFVYEKGDSVDYYWLIVKEENKAYGPLDSLSFWQLRKEYNVSDKLSLDKITYQIRTYDKIDKK